MNQSIFRAYDIRGRYPEELDERVVAEIASILTRYFKKGKIVLGHDNRLSSPSLYAALVKVFEKEKKFTLEKAGMVTTPMLYFLVHDLKASGGVVVTASHSPKEYNGLKAVGQKAMMISGKDIYGLFKTLR